MSSYTLPEEHSFGDLNSTPGVVNQHVG